MNIPYWLSRTQLLLGDEATYNLMQKNVLVVGLGGVGGIAAEMIVRAGIGSITIADADTVDLSNCNRQIPALHSTVGLAKTTVMAQRLKDINPELKVTVINEWVKDELTYTLINDGNFDIAVDCIDTLTPKVTFIKACVDKGLPIISSLGAGGKLDATQVTITDISHTHQCNLARYVRKKLHAMGIYKGVTCVYSPEAADQSKIIVSEKAFPKKSLIGTISYMPAVFGCFVANAALNQLLVGNNE